MSDGVGVFLAGMLGVFTGMACLYLSIKLTGTAVSALEAKNKSKGNGRTGRGQMNALYSLFRTTGLFHVTPGLW